MWWFMLISTIISAISSKSYVNCEYVASSSSSSSSSLGAQDDLQEMLNTEKVLINTLRHFIETQETKLNFLKRKTLEIQNIHDVAAVDREKYLYNPINAVIMLKRFTTDWKGLKNYAEEYLNTEDLTNNYTQQSKTLTFPTDDDYDLALSHLLRIQDMYKLESQHLSVGKVNGVKLGSEMSWSDCLEIGLKSSQNGYQTYAKYWIETALEKLQKTAAAKNNNNSSSSNHHDEQTETGVTPPSSVAAAASSLPSIDDYTVKARIQIMKALLNTEYQMGNLEKALKIANEMLQLQPKQKSVIKAKQQIENDLKKNNRNNNKSKNADVKKSKNQIKKTDEELMIEEICREASNIQINKQIHTATLLIPNPSPITPHCSVVTNNLASLLVQPLNVELLSLDPFIVIYHNVISDTEVKDLKDFVIEQDDDKLEFTKIGQKKMRQFNRKLHYIIGHHGQELYDDWRVNLYNFENIMKVSSTSSQIATNKNAGQAKILFNLQHPLMGGSVIFPQLDLSINLPMGSLLYWSTLNEFAAEDYRTKYHICPVIGGTQLTATTIIKKL